VSKKRHYADENRREISATNEYFKLKSQLSLTDEEHSFYEKLKKNIMDKLIQIRLKKWRNGEC